MKKTYYPALDETVYEDTLPNGLPVIVLPKKGFTRKCAYFITNYGSNDTAFTWKGRQCRTPDGVAHYLEHKMFDLPGRDVMAEFSAVGANPNAFTSYSMTAYYFSCTENFEAALELLLTFVSTPYFTEESVEKERGIIGQEIRMYADSADSQVYEDLFAAMYDHHPVRISIAGTEDSIQAITAQTLYDCYAAFYHPGNMALCVVGDVDPEMVRDMAERILPKEPQEQPQRDYGAPETMDIPQKRTQRTMDVAMPTFQAGFKIPWPGPGAVQQELIGDLAAEALMGESSPLYLRLYNSGLIDSSFACGYEDMPGVALLSCGGDSRDPEAVLSAVMEEAKRIAAQGIDDSLFRQLKKSALGRRYRGLDSFDGLCYRLGASHFDGINTMRFPTQYAAITRQQVEDFIRTYVNEENSAMSVVLPRN